jgi:hypothetical protein
VPRWSSPARSAFLLLATAAACGLSTEGTEAPVGIAADGGPIYPDTDAAGATSGSGGSSSGYGSSGGSSSGSGSSGGSGAGDDGGGGDATGGPGADGAAGPCNYNGTWASQLTINVNWSPQGFNSIILAPGTGQIKQWIRGDRTQNGTALTDATVVCGIRLPDFQSSMLAASETYGVIFPGTLFDSHYLPTFTVNATVSGPTPGSSYSTQPSVALLGISLANPASDAWPTTVSTAVDMDQDMKAGVTIDVATSADAGSVVYSGVPVGIPAPFQPTVRASHLYVAIRQVTVVSGTVVDCNHISGSVTIPTVAGKVGIDSHVLGCALAAGGDCSTTQANFVDNTQPVFTPTGTGVLKSIKVPAGTSCATIRQMLP